MCWKLPGEQDSALSEAHDNTVKIDSDFSDVTPEWRSRTNVNAKCDDCGTSAAVKQLEEENGPERAGCNTTPVTAPAPMSSRRSRNHSRKRCPKEGRPGERPLAAVGEIRSSSGSSSSGSCSSQRSQRSKAVVMSECHNSGNGASVIHFEENSESSLEADVPHDAWQCGQPTQPKWA